MIKFTFKTTKLQKRILAVLVAVLFSLMVFDFGYWVGARTTDLVYLVPNQAVYIKPFCSDPLLNIHQVQSNEGPLLQVTCGESKLTTAQIPEKGWQIPK